MAPRFIAGAINEKIDTGTQIFFMPSSIGHLGEATGRFSVNPNGENTMGMLQDVSVAVTVVGVGMAALPSIKAPLATPVASAAETAAVDSQYFIASGVRRSLSSLQNGATDIPATIVNSGQADIQTTLKLNQLFSPKFEVPADSRFLNIQPPIRVPIEVQPLGIPGQPTSIPLNQVKIIDP